MCGSAMREGGSGRRWTGLDLALMITGFVVFWPLGLAVLFWRGLGRSWPWEAGAGWTWNALPALRRTPRAGNQAFEAWQAEARARIEEERRQLDAEIEVFRAFRETEMRAAEKRELDRFLSERDVAAKDAGAPG
jgi:hypothetical protein